MELCLGLDLCRSKAGCHDGVLGAKTYWCKLSKSPNRNSEQSRRKDLMRMEIRRPVELLSYRTSIITYSLHDSWQAVVADCPLAMYSRPTFREL